MTADKETIDWIDKFTKEQELYQIPYDKTGYEIKVFEKPENRLMKYWEAHIGKWHKPWNYELEKIGPETETKCKISFMG